MTNRILLIRTGGTIDAQDYDDPKAPPQNIVTLKSENSPIFPIIKTLPNHENIDNHIWDKHEEKRFVKDSKFFTPEEIKSLAEIIKKDQRHAHFLLTHGTDAIVENAILLNQELENSNKTVLFIGSIVPLSMRQTHKCTGVETLRYAIENIYECPPGIYIVGTDLPNGKWGLFDPAYVYKDIATSLERATLTLATR